MENTNNNTNLETRQQDIGGIRVERIVPTSLDNFAIKNQGGLDLYEVEQRQARTVPNFADVNTDQDRTLTVARGPYQIALKAERLALIDDINAMSDLISREAINRNKKFDKNGFVTALKYIPNSRFAYYNKLIREGLQRRRFSQDDVDFVNTVWMSNFTKQQLRDFFSIFLDPSIQSYTVPPTQSRSGIKLQPAIGDKLALKLSNPGTLYFPATLAQNDDSKEDPTKLVRLVQRMDQRIRALSDAIELSQQTSELYSQTEGPLQKNTVVDG